MKTYIVSIMAASFLIAGCKQSVETASEKFNQLPPPVQKTVRAHAPNAEIAKVDTKTIEGQTVYEVEFADAGANPKVLVAPDGKLISTDMTTTKGAPGTLDRLVSGRGAVGTKLSALPKSVQKTIQEKAPNAEIADINRKEDNGVVVYEIEFKDKGVNPTMRVMENGTLIDTK